jgi:hypothetical protein
MIKLMKFINVLFFSPLLFIGCVNPIEKQVGYLLPKSTKLELVSEQEVGITNFYVYEVEGELNTDNLLAFPVNVISEKEKDVVKWHKPNDNELRDIKMFVKEEQADNEIAVQLLENLSTDKEYLIALIYDKDGKPLGMEGYSVYDWMELYFLDAEEKKLTHISYGKF